MSAVSLTPQEEEELYVELKPQEATLTDPLQELLKRIEKSLFERLTIGELENLAARFAPGR